MTSNVTKICQKTSTYNECYVQILSHYSKKIGKICIIIQKVVIHFKPSIFRVICARHDTLIKQSAG